ncbi:FAD-binding oxidoreductase [Nocardioides aurantiacus]|uniref:Alkyldihydroxyacetonephosphate synthase n=1 Tax=Nocardioides aurantiacus TaxID=86796 RepID=A0A3N2CTG9_9ACTN|nr:FAD-binding oxidoreductase [Nocardioides aurantiacus]ROR90829.1 alkyldihydroxyacetonephosphate synthase [Nocardioides aurantiacus]
MTREMHPQRWGDPRLAGPLSEATQALVDAAFGAVPTPAVDRVVLPGPGLAEELLASLAGAVGTAHVHTDEGTRRSRTRGKSTPDLLRARAGDLSDAPDAVVRPGSHDEVVAVLAWAREHHVAVVPFGGGTSVTGGLVATREGYAGVVSLDLARLDGLLAVDPVSMTATLQPGMRGPEAEAALAEHGLTLGHFPQSFEHASIGGFAATRSSGQNSAGFGRFDQMVVGLRAATPVGEIVAGAAPASAAGPDLRQLLLGSEGAFGVITEVTVRVRARPAEQVHEAWRFESFAAGREAVRHLAQHQLLPTIVRLSDETETALNLASQSDVGGEGVSGCLMVVGHEGDAVERRRAEVAEALAAAGGSPLGEKRGRHWREGRFAAPYLRDSMLDAGVLVETLETATFWSGVDRLRDAVTEALQDGLGEGTLVLCHVSHVYETGCSLYFTVAARQGEDPLGRWLAAKAAASDAVLAAGGTITHHHAVGTDHRPWLAREVGPVGVTVLRAVKAALDPTGVLNPGVMVP